MASYTIVGAGVSEDEAAAAIAAIACIFEQEAATSAQPVAGEGRRGWCDAARLVVQGLSPSRPPVAVRWGRVERLRRAGRGGTGIVGQ